MLTRIGAAGAIAWVTPVVTSLNMPAFAGSQPKRSCDHPFFCRSAPFECGPGVGPFPCFCFNSPGGGGTCVNDDFCVNLAACDPEGICPPGFACGIDTCCGEPKCFPLCDGKPTQLKDAGVRHGMTGAGQR
jgi:hypothetical protein